MIKNKKMIICIILIILIIAIILIKIFSKDDASSSGTAYTKPEFVDHSEEIITILDSAEEEYQAGKSFYTRVDFYNTTTLNFQVDGYYIEFITEDSISDYCTYYDSEGNEVEEIPEIEVEITLPTQMNVGDYYLLRYYDYDENYVYYYVTELTDAGFEELELYVITEGESVLNDEIMMDDIAE